MKKIVIILLFLLLLINSLSSKPDSLIAYWSFEDSTARDFSGNGYHGVLVNNPKPVKGIKNGTGMNLTCKGYYIVVGTDLRQIGDHILLPRIHFENLGSFTISMWVYEESMSHFHGDAYILFGNWSTGWLGITHAAPLPDTTNYINFTVGGKEVSNCLKIPFNYANRFRWMHYCLVYNNGKLDAYINGDYKGSIFQPIYISENTQAIGRHWWYYSNEYRTSARFTGIIDEVKIFSKGLSEREIKGEYESSFLLITSDSITLCEGDSLELRATDGYSDYLWSTGDRTRSIKVTRNGVYELTATNKDGLKLKASYNVNNFVNRNIEIHGLDGNSSIHFQELFKEKLNCRKIIFSNREAKEITLKKIFLSNNVNFSISQSQLPLIILPNSSRELEICFSPRNDKTKDTLIIYDSCYYKELYLDGILQINSYYGASQCDVMLKAKDTVVNIESIANLFPNPCDDFLNFDIKSNSADLQISYDNFKLYNSLGNELLLPSNNVKIFNDKKQINVQIDIGQFISGFYILTIDYNSKIFHLKFIISH
jgi:hypothetical protein